MADHYFSESPESGHAFRFFEHEDRGRKLGFETDAGVFSREHMDKGTLLLLDALPTCGGRALDLGCGWGGLGVCYLARNPGLGLVMCDVNGRAVDLARGNLARNGLVAQVIQSDGLDKVEGGFDVIAFNPPIRAGKAVVYRLFEEAIGALKTGGGLYVVIRKQQGAPSAQAFLKERLDGVDVIARGSGFWVLRGMKGPAL